tara:strand:+ start:196 stop:402 length:207 start_codon:yes stop_codon:yes gene_type:complete
MTKELIKEALSEYFAENSEQQYYTVSEAAKYHRVTPRTILNKIHQDKVKYKRLGNSYRIPKEEINNIL